MAVHRIGLVVPSPNATVETELPALLRPHPFAGFSFHSTRMQMHTISAAELAAMNAQRERCVMEIADASPDVILYACPIAVMVGDQASTRASKAVSPSSLRPADRRPWSGPAPVRSSRRCARSTPAGSRSSPPTCGHLLSKSSDTWSPRASRSATGAPSRSPATPKSVASLANVYSRLPAPSTHRRGCPGHLRVRADALARPSRGCGRGVRHPRLVGRDRRSVQHLAQPESARCHPRRGELAACGHRLCLRSHHAATPAHRSRRRPRRLPHS